MELVAIMATVILLATLSTLIFAFAAYVITRAKRKRKPQNLNPVVSEADARKRTFFEKYKLGSLPKAGDESKVYPDTSQWM